MCRKGIFRKRVRECRNVRYVHILHQHIGEQDGSSLGIRNSVHRPECRIRTDHSPMRPHFLRCLCLEHRVTVICGEFDDKDDSMVLEYLPAVVDIGVGKVTRTARTAADIGAGQALCVIESLEYKGLARTHPVDIDKGKGVIKAYGKRNAFGTDICGDLFHALGGCECHRTAPHILVVQGQRHHMRPLNHALAEHLQQNLGTPVLRVHIVGTRILCTCELAACRHQEELHIGR